MKNINISCFLSIDVYICNMVNINNDVDNEVLVKELLKDEMKRLKELEKELKEKYEKQFKEKDEKNKVYHQRIKIGEAYKVNPFVMEDGKMILGVDRKIKKKIHGSTEDVLMNVITGDMKGTSVIMRNKETDSNTFVKVFIASYDKLSNLGKAGQKLAHYIISNLKPNDDKIYIHIPEVCEFCGWKARNQFYTALKELYKNELLAPSEKSGIYFINPNVLFNGDRLLLIQQYTKIGSNQLELFKEIE